MPSRDLKSDRPFFWPCGRTEKRKECNVNDRQAFINVSSENSRARALAFEHGRIVAVGGRIEVQSLGDQGWPTPDLARKTVLPGFIDTQTNCRKDEASRKK
jgi:imidazolonepropionase-like amidohydrolase